MKMDKIKSLKIALAAVIVLAVVLIGVSYSTQKNAENQVAILLNAVNSASSLEQLKNSAVNFGAYSGAGSSASAAVADPSCGDNGRRATEGDDAGMCIGSLSWLAQNDNNDWWNGLWPF